MYQIVYMFSNIFVCDTFYIQYLRLFTRASYTELNIYILSLDLG